MVVVLTSTAGNCNASIWCNITRNPKWVHPGHLGGENAGWNVASDNMAPPAANEIGTSLRLSRSPDCIASDRIQVLGLMVAVICPNLSGVVE